MKKTILLFALLFGLIFICGFDIIISWPSEDLPFDPVETAIPSTENDPDAEKIRTDGLVPGSGSWETVILPVVFFSGIVAVLYLFLRKKRNYSIRDMSRNGINQVE